MHRSIALAALCFAALAGCDSADDPDYTFEATATAYAAGDDVALRLVNTSGDVLGYNLCVSTLEVRQDDGWQSILDDRVCTAELLGLDPGASAEIEIALPSDAVAGTYRFFTQLEVDGRGRLAQTPSFTVR